MSEVEEEVKVGAFVSSLKRNNKQIRDDRAESIAEDAQLTYRRHVEDLQMKIKRLVRQRDNMLDMSPDNAQSLMVAKNFDATGFVELDNSIGLEIRNLQIKLDIAEQSYTNLFGEL